ncbi:MAG TPA: MarR family transcriptional regulator [Polyangiaceae bacterium]|nr:MarR family transcriptional regulator [Polyangiaceae bacterium]
MRKKRAPRRAAKEKARGAVQSVVDETIALFHWLAWVSDQIYGDEARGAARRWTLRRLHRDGPCTVPELARARAIRRQSIQPVVDALVRDGLVRVTENPRHARSVRFAITDAGAKLVDRLDRVDARVLRAVSRGIVPRDLAVAASTLQRLRAGFETGARWRVAAQSS